MLNLHKDDSVTVMQRAAHQMRVKPRFATMAAYIAQFRLEARESVGTAATNCTSHIWFSPSYIEGFTVDECISVLIHEGYHPFLNFFPRFERWARKHPNIDRKRLLKTFNIAQDYGINWLIKHEWKMPIQEGWKYDPKYNPTDYTAEMIADELLADPSNESGDQPDLPGTPDDQPESGDNSEAGNSPDSNESEPSDEPSDESGDGESGDGESGEGESGADDKQAGEGDDVVLPDCYGGDINNVPSDADLKQMEHDNRLNTANADRAAAPLRKRGDGTGDPMMGEIERSQYRAAYSWAAELRKYAKKSAAIGSWSYHKPNHRMRTAQGILYPSKVGKQLGTAVFAVDSSGSTSGAAISYFIEELKRAMLTAEFEKAVVIWCSDEIPVEGVQEYTKAQIKSNPNCVDDRRRKVGGGTHFMPVFEYVAKHYPNASVLTYLTDGCVGDYEIKEVHEHWATKNRRIPLLWALCDMGWTGTERFIESANQRRLGKVCLLPMEKI